MNLHRFLILGAAIATVTACSNNDTAPKIITPGPAGFVRFINAVPDTGAQDFRFTDVVEGVPNVEFVNLAFRGGTDRAYQRVSVGSHHIRVFMSGSNLNAGGFANDAAIVSTVMGDTTFTFAEGVHYTFLWQGASRSAAQKFVIFTDNFTAPASGKFSIRALNASTAAADFCLSSGTATLPLVNAIPGIEAAVGSGVATCTVAYAGVASNTASAWTDVTVASSSGNYVMSATAAGSAVVIASTVCPAGTAAVAEVPLVSGALQATAGCRIASSVLSAYLFPISVVGSKAASFTTRGIVFVVDKQPWQ